MIIDITLFLEIRGLIPRSCSYCNKKNRSFYYDSLITNKKLSRHNVKFKCESLFVYFQHNAI